MFEEKTVEKTILQRIDVFASKLSCLAYIGTTSIEILDFSGANFSELFKKLIDKSKLLAFFFLSHAFLCSIRLPFARSIENYAEFLGV